MTYLNSDIVDSLHGIMNTDISSSELCTYVTYSTSDPEIAVWEMSSKYISPTA